ncbi:hypothetical protein C0J52_03660 [Blattella germanica]|nr:hypothetical protein C0J52_03660 [Blattella germanica]
MFLQSLIDISDVKQRRPRKESHRVNSASFKYHHIVGVARREVCVRAFYSVFDINEARVRRIRQLKLVGKVPEDKRGRGVTFSLPTKIKDLIREHIDSFPLKESHYLGKKQYYLSAGLNVKYMWRLFNEKYGPNVKVSYYSYRHYFRENFNYRFGRPQVDTCCQCEELQLKIKSPHLNDVAKRTTLAELLVHKRKSKKFYSVLQEESSKGQVEENVLSLTFDFMQNLSLPKIPVQELFYLRQLTVNVFCITNIKTNKSSLYIYHEGNGRKGPDEVCSFLNDYLKHNVPNNITELRLFSDNCSGQNKNQTLCRYLLFLTDRGRFNKITQYFPIRGHSFMPCDRVFGVIKQSLRRHDRYYSIREITELIIKSAKPGKIEVKEVVGSDIINFKSWWKPLYKKIVVSEETKHKPRNDKVLFSISNLYQFEYNSERRGYVRGYQNIMGLICHTFILGLTRDLTAPEIPAYPSGMVSIKVSKKKTLTKSHGTYLQSIWDSMRMY